MQRVRLTTDEVDGVRVARLEGDLDKLGVEAARSRLDPLAVGKLVVDLDGVTFIDSAGLHALFALSRLATSQGGALALAVAESSPSARAIALVHLAEVMPVRATVEAAIAALQVSSPADVG
jgi:anti-sigma B factor antagonist